MRTKDLMGLVALVCLLPVAAAAQTEGHQLTDELIDRAETTVRQIALTRWEAREAVDAYNAFIDGTGDSRSAHAKLTRQVDKTEKQLAKTRRAVDRMETAAGTFFGDWSASIERMSDEDMRAKAFGRMSGTRDRYEEILALGRGARDEFDSFVSLLKDTLVFAEHDLNPEGLAELREESERVNDRAKSLRREIDRTIGTAHRYIDSLRPE